MKTSYVPFVVSTILSCESFTVKHETGKLGYKLLRTGLQRYNEFLVIDQATRPLAHMRSQFMKLSAYVSPNAVEITDWIRCFTLDSQSCPPLDIFLVFLSCNFSIVKNLS